MTTPVRTPVVTDAATPVPITVLTDIQTPVLTVVRTVYARVARGRIRGSSAKYLATSDRRLATFNPRSDPPACLPHRYARTRATGRQGHPLAELATAGPAGRQAVLR